MERASAIYGEKMICPNKYQKSSLRAYNTSTQTFTTEGNAIFSNVGYVSGLSIRCFENSDTIYLKHNGLYYITVDVVMGNGTVTTDTTVQLYIDGAIVPGAKTTSTIATTSTSQVGTISCIIPVEGCCCPCNQGSKITVQVSGTTAEIDNINVNVIRLA